jgi:hypothetical protein
VNEPAGVGAGPASKQWLGGQLSSFEKPSNSDQDRKDAGLWNSRIVWKMQVSFERYPSLAAARTRKPGDVQVVNNSNARRVARVQRPRSDQGAMISRIDIGIVRWLAKRGAMIINGRCDDYQWGVRCIRAALTSVCARNFLLSRLLKNCISDYALSHCQVHIAKLNCKSARLGLPSCQPSFSTICQAEILYTPRPPMRGKVSKMSIS